MKKLTLFLLAALSMGAQAFGQAVYSGTLTAQTTTIVNDTHTTVIVPLPLATITVYNYGTAVKASVCPDATQLGCTASAPNNPITADVRGNFGFWIGAGSYDYTITPVSGTVQGPYHITLGTSNGYINAVTDCGLPRDGVTDATTALNVCLTANPGKHVLLPKVTAPGKWIMC